MFPYIRSKTISYSNLDLVGIFVIALKGESTLKHCEVKNFTLALNFFGLSVAKPGFRESTRSSCAIFPEKNEIEDPRKCGRISGAIASIDASEIDQHRNGNIKEKNRNI